MFLFKYLGFEVLDPFVAYAAPRVDKDMRKEYLLSWKHEYTEIIEDPEWQACLRNYSGFEARMKNIVTMDGN